MSNENDVMKILVATDNHIGYMERDPVRGGDSLEAFKEILTIAKEKEVDFILLGGDLFHENKPSRHVIYRTMELLRNHCMGGRPCPLEFRSDPSINFSSKFPVVNYEDPDFNIAMPVFAIHGNHDDPTGDSNISAMDILDVANLINYFGKVVDVEDITISPVLLQKGSTKLALYGLGSVRDQRLNQTFRRGKVRFLQPQEDGDDWFNLFVLHQNRAPHGERNHIPATFLPSFLDLVVWAHEHESRPEPEYASTDGEVGELCDGEFGEKGFFIYQPGSSVATSLCEGEVPPKHIGILSIKGTEFRVDPIVLKTVRPFIMDSICLKETGIDPGDESEILDHLAVKVEELIERVSAEHPESNKTPLIRLKVDYSGDYPVLNYARFAQQFVKKVANPRSILHWYKRKETHSLARKRGGSSSLLESDAGDQGAEDGLDVSILLTQQLKQNQLNLLSEKVMTEAVTEFVEKSERESISDFVECSLRGTQKYLKEQNFPETELETQIQHQRGEIMSLQEEKTEEQKQRLAQIRSQRPDRASESELGDNDMDTEQAASTAASNRGRGGRGARGRGSRGGRGSRTKKSQSELITGDGVFASSNGNVGTSRGRGRGRGSKKSATKSTLSFKYENVDSDGDDSHFSSYKRGRIFEDSNVVDLTQFGDDSDEDSNPFTSFSSSKRTRR